MQEAKKWEQYTEEDILQANIEKYQDEATLQFYKEFEESKYPYHEFHVIFSNLISFLRKNNDHPIRVADICGGSGQASFIVKKYDVDSQVTLVDLSEDMLDIAREKMNRANIKGIEIIQEDAFSFLKKGKKYDLIVFSSAIHHFKDPIELISLAAENLSANGVIITIADPTNVISSRRYKFFEFLAVDATGKKERIKKSLSTLFNKSPQTLEDFDLAEYQTLKGIDDKKLIKDLALKNMYPIMHIRYPAGEPHITKIMPWFGLSWAFSTILHKGNISNSEELNNLMRKSLRRDLPFRVSIYK